MKIRLHYCCTNVLTFPKLSQSREPTLFSAAVGLGTIILDQNWPR